uniref:Uncharacterized protein n=1 Tax=Anguilla anguilla TaxID=7936 RepID=A0A0E9S2Y2_ANGAN
MCALVDISTLNATNSNITTIIVKGQS